MTPDEVAAAAAIHAHYSIGVAYVGRDVSIDPLSAVKTDVPAEEFQGPGATKRRVSFEVRQADLPARPMKKETLRELPSGQLWSINQVTRLDDVGSWWIDVEVAPS